MNDNEFDAALRNIKNAQFRFLLYSLLVATPFVIFMSMIGRAHV